MKEKEVAHADIKPVSRRLMRL